MDIKVFEEIIQLLFSPIKVSFDWGLFFGLVGTFLAIISLIKNKEKRGFELRQGDTYYRAKLDECIKDNAKVIYKNEQVQSLINTTFFLENTGNVELKIGDFKNYCELSFNENVKILEYQIFSSNKFTVVRSKVKDNMLFLKILYIEPKAFIKINVLYMCEKLPKPKFSIDVIRANKVIYNLEDHNNGEHMAAWSKDSNFLSLWISICLVILMGIAFIFGKVFNLNIYSSGINGIPKGWLTLIIIAALIPTYLIFNSVYKQLSFNRNSWHDIKNWEAVKFSG